MQKQTSATEQLDMNSRRSLNLVVLISQKSSRKSLLYIKNHLKRVRVSSCASQFAAFRWPQTLSLNGEKFSFIEPHPECAQNREKHWLSVVWCGAASATAPNKNTKRLGDAINYLFIWKDESLKCTTSRDLVLFPCSSRSWCWCVLVNCWIYFGQRCIHWVNRRLLHRQTVCVGQIILHHQQQLCPHGSHRGSGGMSDGMSPKGKLGHFKRKNPFEIDFRHK